MRNKEKQIMKDAEFIRTHIAKDTQSQLPRGLETEEIVAICEGKKQKSNVKQIIRRSVALAAALAVVIGSAFVFDKAVYIPQIKTDGQKIATADDYSQIIEMIKDYRTSTDFADGDYFNLYGAKYAANYAADGAVEESEINGAVNFADSKSFDTAESITDNADSSGTLNTREADVDESDIVRTDGKHLFVASTSYGRIIILEPDENGAMKPISSIQYSEEDSWMWSATEMYVRDGLLIVCFPYSYQDKKASVKIYDISDITAPKLVRTLSQDGSDGQTRITDGKLIFTSAYYVNGQENYTEDNCIPKVYNGEEESKIPCQDIILADTEEPEAFCVITTFNLNDLQSKPVTQSVLGSGFTVYCTSDRLFLYGSKYKSDTCIMNVRGFDITDNGVEYAGCCEFEGYFYDSFSMDWDGENLRVAATTNDANNLYIYDKSFNLVGTLEGFGENEDIEGIRFMGNTAYIVTFENTDPLFVMDLSDPTKPQITGELVMPGFSDYLHPVGENLMLGIGSGGNEDGLDGSAKASLYDVSDPANPKIVTDCIIENAWFNTDYKAFVTAPDGNGWFVPYSRSEPTETDNGTDWDWNYSGKTGVVLLTLNAQGKLETSVFFETDEALHCDECESDCWLYFSRTTVINGNVYTTDSSNGVWSWSADGQKLGELHFGEYFEQAERNYYCFDDVLE